MLSLRHDPDSLAMRKRCKRPIPPEPQLSEALLYKDARVRKFWNETASSRAGWYFASIVEVTPVAEGHEDAQARYRNWFRLRYDTDSSDEPDQEPDQEDVTWDTLWDPETCEVTSTPREAEALHFGLRQQLSGKQPAAQSVGSPPRKRLKPAAVEVPQTPSLQPVAARAVSSSTSQETSTRSPQPQPAPKRRPGREPAYHQWPEEDAEVEEADRRLPSPLPRKRARLSGSQDPQGSQGEATADVHPYGVADPPDCGRPGFIKRVHVTHFMCHDNLEVDFEPHVTFISGKNGSGKSAVLQAMQCCLGAKARDTGRGNSLASLIKDGANHASVAVTLWNTSEEAYERERYGPHLTIERKLTRGSGGGCSTTFTIKDADGRKVAVGRAELDAILDRFNIDVSNPAICMTQDTARTFAGEQSARKKFELYFEAAGFTCVIEELNRSSLEITGIRDELEKQHAELKRKEEQLKAVQDKVDGMREVKYMRDLQHHLGDWTTWEPVLVKEAKRDRLEQTLEVDAPRFRNQSLAELEESKTRLDEAEAAFQEQKAKLAALGASMSREGEQLGQLNRAVRERKAELRDRQRALSKARDALRQLEDQRSALEASAIEQRATDASESQGVRATHAAELQQSQRAAAEALAAAEQAREALREAEAAKRKCHAEEREAAADVAAANSRVQGLQEELHRMQAQQESPAAAFGGPNMIPLKQRIAHDVAARRFDRWPIGPIGMLLSLQDELWAKAVENACGAAFNQFIVHSSADGRHLQELAQQVGVRINYIVYSYDIPLLDTSRANNRPVSLPNGLMTVAKALRFSADPALANAAQAAATLQNVLTDHWSIERTGLVSSQAEARQLVEARDSWVTTAFLADGTRVYARGSTTTSIPPGQGRAARLRSDVAAAIADVRQELAAAQIRLDEAQQRLTAARASKAQAMQAVRQAQDAKRNAESQHTQCESQLELVASQQPPAEDEDEDDAAASVAAEVAALTRIIQEREPEVAACQEAVNQAAEAVRAAEEAHAGSEAARKRLVAESEAAARAAEQGAAAVQAAKEHMHSCQQALIDLDATATRIRSELRVAKEDAAAERTRAEGIVPQAEAEAARDVYAQHLRGLHRSEAEIKKALEYAAAEKEFESLTRHIKAAERHAGATLGELQDELASLERWVAENEPKIQAADRALDALQEGHEARRKAAKEVRKNIDERMSALFNRYLQRRGFRGRIKVHLAETELEMIVQLGKGGSKAQDVNDMKSLSGGERSFTTLCFMLALGSINHAPFHVLDEFDVFMDDVNRQLSLHTLLQTACRSDETQFILLSPEDVKAVKEAHHRLLESTAVAEDERAVLGHPKFLKIVTMPEPRPRRGST